MNQPGLMVREQDPAFQCVCMHVYLLPLALHASGLTLLHFIQMRNERESGDLGSALALLALAV